MEFSSEIPAHSSFWVKYWILSLDDDQTSVLGDVAKSFITSTRSANYAWNWETPHIEPLEFNSFKALFGSTRTYSSLCDEHTILWILRELTKKHPNIAVRIVDEFGEFILSMAEEAAGFSMPSWMSEPSYMAGKVWLKGGRWTFLKPMGSRRPETSLEDARNALKGDTSKYSIMTYKAVDMGVDATLEEYPLRHGNATKARVILPDKWAKFLRDHHTFGMAIHERDHIVPGMKAAKGSENCANIILSDEDATQLIKPKGTHKMVLCTVTFSRNRFIEVLHTGEDLLSGEDVLPEETGMEAVLYRGVSAFLTPLMSSKFYHSFDSNQAEVPWSEAIELELQYVVESIMPLFAAESESNKGEIENTLRRNFKPAIEEFVDQRRSLNDINYVSLDEVTLSSWDSFQEDTDAWMADVLQAEADNNPDNENQEMEQRLQELMERIVGIDGIDDIDDISHPNASSDEDEADSDDESDHEDNDIEYNDRNENDENKKMLRMDDNPGIGNNSGIEDSYNLESQFFRDEIAAGVGREGDDLGDIDEDDFFEYFLTNALNLTPEQIEQMRSVKPEEPVVQSAEAEDDDLSQQLIDQLMNLELEEHGIVESSSNISEQLRESLELAPDRLNNPTAALLRGAGVSVPRNTTKK